MFDYLGIVLSAICCIMEFLFALAELLNGNRAVALGHAVSAGILLVAFGMFLKRLERY